MSEFTHFNDQGRAHMVDIGDKQSTERTAVAHSSVHVTRSIYENIKDGSIEKGDVLGVAQVAGIMAAKQTSSWIPMCHPLPLKKVDVVFEWLLENDSCELVIETSVKTQGATGVEMEALTAASATALTIYDMCKALDKGMTIGPTYLLEKTGGKSGHYSRKEQDYGTR